jgi:oligosaccharide repeat unit polymerase
MIFLLVNLLTAATTILSRVLTGSWFSPPGVFAAVWGTSLGLLSVTIGGAYPLQDLTWLVIFTGWLSFLLGTLLTGPAYKDSGDPAGSVTIPPGFERAIMIMSILALIGGARFAWVVIGQIGLFPYFDNPLSVRYLLTIGGVSTGTLTPIFLGVTLAAAFFAGVGCAVKPRSVWNYGPLVAAVTFDTLSFGRAHTIITVLIYGSAFLLVRRVVPHPKHVAGGRRRWVLIVGLALIAGPYTYVSLVRDRPSVKGTIGMLQPYLANISQNWYLVDDVITNRDDRRPCVNTMLPFLLVLHRVGLRPTDPRHEQLFSRSGRLASGRLSNTYTVVGASYTDFGVFGVAVYLFAIGFVSNLLFVLYRRSPQLWHIAGLSFVYPMLALTIQAHQLSSPPFVMALGLTMGVVVALSWLPRRSTAPAGLHYRST